MIIRYSQSWIPSKSYGVTIWPFIFYRYAEDEIMPFMKAHEEYHWKHQLKWLVIPWFIVYAVLWLFYGYRDHPWEEQARRAERDTA